MRRALPGCRGEDFNSLWRSEVEAAAARPTGAAADVAGTAVAACFFVFVLVIGCYLFMNLFIAILLEAFAGGDEEEDEAEGEDAAPEVAPDATVDALVSRLGAALGADEGFRATSRGKVSACVKINVASMA